MMMSALLLALPACQRQDGPAERAGKDIDKAVQGAGRQIEKAGEDMQDAARREKR
jgi:hypothetical protein